jgi:hypothetical protein
MPAPFDSSEQRSFGLVEKFACWMVIVEILETYRIPSLLQIVYCVEYDIMTDYQEEF